MSGVPEICCKDCGKTKSIDQFYKRSNGLIRQPCKRCYSDRQGRRYLQYKSERLAEAQSLSASLSTISTVTISLSGQLAKSDFDLY